LQFFSVVSWATVTAVAGLPVSDNGELRPTVVHIH